MSVIGADGIPSVAVKTEKTKTGKEQNDLCVCFFLKNAGNVLRAQTTMKLSFRLPPTCDVETAKKGIERVIKSAHIPCDEKAKESFKQSNVCVLMFSS